MLTCKLYCDMITSKKGGTNIMDIFDRIIKVRSESKESQEKFAAKLGLSRNFINQVENKKKNVSDRTISDICREYNINEEWLRTGSGDMTVPISKDKEISRMLATVLKSDENDFKRRLISALSRLDDEGWEQLEILIDMISGAK